MPSVSANRVDLVDDLAVHQGSTYQHSFTPTGVDLTSSAAKMQVRTSRPDGALILELISPVTAGKGIALGAAGEIDIIVPAAEDWSEDGSLVVVEERYVYDLLVTTGAIIDSVAQGQIAVVPGVTRPPP